MWQRRASATILPQGWHFTFYLKPLGDHVRFRTVVIFCSLNGNGNDRRGIVSRHVNRYVSKNGAVHNTGIEHRQEFGGVAEVSLLQIYLRALSYLAADKKRI